MMTRFRTMQAAPAMQIPVFMILMTAPVYVPRDLIQGWVATAAEINPFTAIVESGRSLMAGDPFHVLLAFAAAAGLRRDGGLRASRPAQGRGGRLRRQIASSAARRSSPRPGRRRRTSSRARPGGRRSPSRSAAWS